jgi:hypothetical protein
MKQKGKPYTHYLPKVNYKAARRAWFTHAGTAYPVISAPAHVFSAAVLERAPKWKYSGGYMAMLKQDEIDYQTRWWLLCCLADDKRGLALYESREAAVRACAEQMVG